MHFDAPRLCIAVTLLVISCTKLTTGYRALFLAPISAKSHKNFYMGIAQAIAKDGNEVTILTPYKPTKPTPNITQVVMEGAALDNFFPNAFAGNRMTAPLTVIRRSFGVCMETLGSAEVAELMGGQRRYDVVLLSLFFSDCYLAVVHRLKLPYIYVLPTGLRGPMGDVVGNPAFPSFSVSSVLPMRHPLTFAQRAVSTVSDSFGSFIFNKVLGFVTDIECRRKGLCPDDMPHINLMRQNSSLLIANEVKNFDVPAVPAVPAVVHAGGIHCKPAKPLPEDLEQWVSEAGEAGFIFFSLGSAVKPSDMPEEYRQILVKVFASLPQHVLWKWDENTMADLPSNVRLGQWLPQQDILSHPKLRLFITHGGLHSTLEAAFHATPVLGIPVFGDQMGNILDVERQGWGRSLTWDELGEDRLKEEILHVIGNEKMLEEVRKRSAFMRDVPTTPSQDVAFWVGYVVRHSGAPHLRSPILDMQWYQVYNVDVWVTFTVIFSLIVYLLIRLLCFCCLRFRKQKKE